MKLIQSLLILAAMMITPAFAKKVAVIPEGSKIFIAQMESGLDGFLAPEIIKKKIPVQVVTDEALADYVLAGASIKADDKWYHVVFGGKDKNEGNVRLLDVKNKRMVWAGEAGDRSLWMTGWKRGGQRKVADRIAKQMKKDLFAGVSKQKQ